MSVCVCVCVCCSREFCEETMGLDLELYGEVVLFFACLNVVCWIVSPFLWRSSFNALDFTNKGMWVSTMVSTVHAVLAVYGSIHVVLDKPSLLYVDDFFMASEKGSFLGHIFLGYLSVDMLYLLYFKFPKVYEMQIHHICCLLCWYQLVGGDENHDSYGLLFSVTAIFCELTTPSVNLLWFQRTTNTAKGFLFTINGLFMTLSFFATRVCGFLWLGYKFFLVREQVMTLATYRVVTLVFFYFTGLFLQLLWFQKMFLGCIKTLQQGSIPTDKKFD